MDSLLANYASSDEEEETQPPKRTALPSAPTNDDDPSFSKSSSSSLLFSSLPKPKPSSSLFQTLPQPKQQPSKTPSSLDQEDHSKAATKSSATLPETPSGFSNLPPPKPTSSLSSSDPKPKRVVQFKPPTNPFSVKSTEIDDEDEDEELEKERKRRRDSELASGTSSVKSFLSSIPVPKNSVTLGALPTSGSGRRAVVETELSASNSGASSGGNDGNSASYDQNAENYGHYYGYGSYESNPDQNAGNYGSYENYNPGYDQTGLGVGSGDGSGYGSYGDYGQYGNNWVEGSVVAAVPEDSGVSQTGFKVSGKRGRNEVPTEIIEVNQDELMKNRPREDQVKLTGIAFGPSYQPVSTKGKPTKLHKRKHQISSLYFDMKQKEMELSERRSRGLLTKAETQAKYGW